MTVLEPDPTANPVPGPPTPSSYPVTTAPTGMLLTTYTYDQLNHLTQAAIPRDASGGMVTQTCTFVYASTTYSTLALPALWLTSATNPENGTVSYTYNADGTLASKLDANGNTETYTYDAYQRLTAIPTRQQTFAYDTCPTTNNTGCVNAAGQLMQATFGSSIGPNYLSFEYNYAYTPAGKVSAKTLQLQSGNHLNVNNVPASGTVAANYTYDSQGALTQMSYTPGIYGSGMAVFNYTLDAMERPTAMTTGSYSWASGVTYNAANQMTYDGKQTRTYNSLMQTTQVGHMTYNYSSNKNNGQIVSSVDAVTTETITYQYDALKRLLSASGKNWGETYAYDGFGNLLQMNPTGTTGAPSLSVTMDNTTNRVTGSGVAYDSNGNLHYGFAGLTLVSDTANRVTEVINSTGDYYYAYDSDNRRIYYRDNNNNETIYFYGADGRKTSSYTMTFISNPNSIQMNPAPGGGNVYFAGILLMEEGSLVRTDRLGSVRWGGPNTLGYQAQYPYGVEYTTTANDREKYATYTRDSDSGMDYAMNRYYSSQWGRFLSPDPYAGSIELNTPQSWNRYTYVGGDPVNGNDPSGLYIGLGGGGGGGGWPGGGEGWGSSPGIGGWGFGFGGGYGCTDPSLMGDPFDADAGLPPWTFGLGQEWCGPGFLPVSTMGPGGGGGATITIKNLSTTSKQAIAVQNDLRWLQAAIDGDATCAKWLGGSDLAINYMLDAPGSGATAMEVGVGSFSPNTVNAVAGTNGTNLAAGSMLLTVNTNGAFFNSGPNSSVGYGVPSWITGGTPAAQAQILLHELAHDIGAQGFIQNDSTNIQAQTANNEMVTQNCGAIVSLIGNH